MEQNKFLMDFMKMRKEINKAKPTINPVKNEEKNIVHNGITYKYIISEKPGKDEVKEYLNQRIADIVRENL
jgi:hypothetical protein